MDLSKNPERVVASIADFRRGLIRKITDRTVAELAQEKGIFRSAGRKWTLMVNRARKAAASLEDALVFAGRVSHPAMTVDEYVKEMKAARIRTESGEDKDGALRTVLVTVDAKDFDAIVTDSIMNGVFPMSVLDKEARRQLEKAFKRAEFAELPARTASRSNGLRRGPAAALDLPSPSRS
jgi:hypothetical protein